MYQMTYEKTSRNEAANKNLKNLVGAVGGMTGGLILMLSGLILSGISFVKHESFQGTEVILLCSAFGLLIVGAHFLDCLEIEKKKARAEFCRKHGLREKDCN